VHLHDAVDAFRIGRFAPGLLCFPAHQSMNAAIAIGWQIGNEPPDVGNQLGIRQRRSSAWPGRWAMAHRGQVWASNSDRLCDGAHRPSRGNEVERNSSLWDSPPLII
jgi:hypothetical protein